MARLFEEENDRIEQQNKVKGIITSIAFHALLFLLFFYLVGVQRANPPLDSEAGGVMVNLGYMDDGSGKVQPMGTANQVEVPQPVASTPPKKIKNNTEDVISQQKTDAPSIVKKTEKKNKKVVKEQKTTPSKPVVNTPPVVAPPKPKSLYKGGAQNNSTSEGTGTKHGDMGRPNGSPFGDSYTGGNGLNGGPGGNGKGFNVSLKGRKLISPPCVSDNSQETGIIVLKITVDKNGKVVTADGPAQGSTTTSSTLLERAKKGVTCCKFDSPNGVPEEEFGSITFNFKVK